MPANRIAEWQEPPRRPRKTPPHVSLGTLRRVAGLRLDDVCNRVHELFPEVTLTRGALSAIESGTRGVSTVTLAALAAVYGIRADEITTDYEPRRGFGDLDEAVA